jgi:type 2 lantibiotic biosynthesis protein LanM
MPVHLVETDRELDTIPFAAAFEAFVASARRGLVLDGLGEGACATLEGHLVARLSSACGPALQREFEAFNPPGPSLLSRFLIEAADGPPAHRYRAFIQGLLHSGWDGFFGKYPVARRIVQGLIEDWREACVELASRIRQDQASRGIVESLKTGISDPHNRGRGVVLLFFSDGSALAYKPRPMDLEFAFSAFLDWCNRRLGLSDFSWYPPRITPRDGYGWMEYIEPRPCLDDSGLRHFYRSGGGLLALLYLLGATDCHCENLIAHGRFPVLIDAETLMQPRYIPPAAAAAFIEGPLDPSGWDTVVRTGFVPRWEITDDGSHVADVSGLAGASEHAAAPGPVWTGVNLDTMQLEEGPVAARPSFNRAALVSGTVDPAPWLAHAEAGFEETWAAVEQVKDELPLGAFASLQTRFIFRPTQLYANLLWQSIQPENLSSLERHRAVFGALSRPFDGLRQPPPELRLVDAEVESLERRDIPCFAIACQSRTCNGISLQLDGSAWDNLNNRLRFWNAQSMARQRAIVRGSVRAFSARPVPFVERAIPFPLASIPEDPGVNGLLLDCARELAEELRSASFALDAGRQWYGLEARDTLDRFQLEPLGLDLYGGSCGVALFFAAAGKVLERPEYAETAREALAPLLRLLRDGSSLTLGELGARLGPGAACGTGSVVYSLTRIARLLDDDALLDDARQAARLLTPEVILADRYFDVVGGLAGGILGLLALHEAAPHPDLLATARSCGDRLLAAQSGEPGRRAWRNFARLPLTGLAHGAAGIALALLRLARSTDCDAYRAAALEARAYERSLFDPARSNWPDLRDNGIAGGQPGFATSWCHGAPGIGLPRLDELAGDEGASLLEIDAALAATLEYGIMGPDYLCCGNMGRVEWILSAGVRLNRADLLAQARAAAVMLCRRAQASGGFRLLAGATADGFKPGFFRGTAGIGYSLLRCAAPEELPCILVFE